MKYRIVEKKDAIGSIFKPQYRFLFIWFSFVDGIMYLAFDTLQDAKKFILKHKVEKAQRSEDDVKSKILKESEQTIIHKVD